MYARKYQLILVEINLQQLIIAPTQTIVNPCHDIVAVKIPKSIFNRNHAKQDLIKHTLCLTDSGHEYILEQI